MTDEKKGHTPKLKMEEYGNICYEDGRWLVEFDSTTDNIEEHRAIVEAVNSHDSLLKQRDEMREVVERILHDLESGFISQDSYKGDMNRKHHENRLRIVLSPLRG